MMVFRYLLYFFRTRLSEQAIEKLADSVPMRRAARFLVRIYQESKSVLPPGAEKLSAEKLKEELLKSEKLQEMARKAKEEFEKRTKQF